MRSNSSEPRHVWLLLACLTLTACQPEPTGPDPAAQAEARALLADYERMRTEGNPELAEARGDALLERHRDSPEAAVVRETLEAVRRDAEAMRETRRLEALWDYQRVAVPGGVQHTAAIYSRTRENPETGFAPEPDARLVLRRHPEWGDSAYLLLNQRALRCPSPCRLQLRFDDGQDEAWAGKPADSGSGPALFIVEQARFLERLQGTQRLRVQLPQSGALVPVFVFEVGGFQPARLRPD